MPGEAGQSQGRGDRCPPRGAEGPSTGQGVLWRELFAVAASGGDGLLTVWVLSKASPRFFCSFSTMRTRYLLPALLSLSLALMRPGGEFLVSPAWAHRAPDQ